MITFSKFKESFIENAKRILKIEEYGAKTAFEAAPFGFDGNPIKDMIAIHAKTPNAAESVVIGYINKDQLAGPGESRMFAVDSNGGLKSFVWCKSDGSIQLNGNDYSGVRFEPLESGLDDFADSINEELLKIQVALSSLGGTYAKQDVEVDISDAKSQNVKLK